MNFKKIIATVTSLVICGSLIAGCEQKTQTTPITETKTNAATTLAEKKEETTVAKVEDAVKDAKSNAEGLVSKAEDKASSVASDAKEAVSKAEDKASSVASDAKETVSKAEDKVGAVASDAKDALSKVEDKASSVASNAGETVSKAEDKANSVASKVEEKVSNTVNAVTPNTNVKMGLSTDEGGRGDKSFNDAAIAGLDKIEKDYGIKPTIIESKEASQYQQNLESIANTSDLIIGVGFKMTDDIKNVASMYPDKKFLLIDGVAEGNNVKNVLFKEQEGSFLLGVIAGKMTKTNKIGFIGGVEGDVIGRFESGFVAGVYSVNKEAGKLLADRTMVRYAGNFSDADKGAELAKDLYNNGADIIFHAAGGVGIGLFNAAKETGKFAMGVDSDQAAMIPDKADVILVSMIKKVDVATYEAAKELIEGRYTTGITTLGLKEDAVGLSPTLHPSLASNAEVMKLVEEYKAKISNGELVVPATLAELKDFVK